MAINRIYFMLMAQDMDRAVGFYRDAFGLQPRLITPDWSELGFGDAVVALHGGGSGEPTDTGLGFDTDDVEAACAAVVAAGGSVVGPPVARQGEGIILAMVRDTEGNRLSIAQPVR